MDPLSITAATISILSTAQETFKHLKHLQEFQTSEFEQLTTVQLEVEIYNKILEEVGQIALSGTSSLPESARLSLRLCQRHLVKVMAEIDELYVLKSGRKSKKPASGAEANLVETMKDYRRSVKILRDIVMDGVTQGLLTNYAYDQPLPQTAGPISIDLDLSQGGADSAKQTESLIKQLQVVFNNSHYTPGPITIRIKSREGTRDEADHSEDILEKLRRAAEGIYQRPRGAQSTSNPFQFFATIIGIQGSSEEGPKVCASLDTASADNWIAASIVERFGLQSLVQPAVEVPYTGAGGHLFYSKGMISVLWTRDSARSWETEFLVQEDAPFDLLLGRRFIIEEGMLVLADPVLVHDNVSRLAPLSKEETHQMEQNMRRRGAENEEIASTREALATAARQRKREAKIASRMSLAASRMSLAPTPGSVTPSSSRPTPSIQSCVPSAGTETTNSNASAATNGSVDTDAGASV
ncbi:uncharacterized protein M421DRAFT_426844 [Didymella exigua CBS 183.55]|uniref:Fungal N-terminal domain-containing protein n=1 Tax=Didymella exigua CBS 183.55 TaxID=1150837 RepID=A0A6A5R498_9PLEO|nr:uncharacterized protein M421DRAFT_426844 [Didymella exigua CBS 183.55]KAF1922502.1 hypothetical protein M421DRAFT_426844 [Didymella exigua CBS 183.55]